MSKDPFWGLNNCYHIVGGGGGFKISYRRCIGKNRKNDNLIVAVIGVQDRKKKINSLRDIGIAR